jgi:hypothetical protein
VKALRAKKQRRRRAETFSHAEFLLGTVVFGVMLCGFFRVMSGMQVVTMRDVGMMPGLFMAPAGVVLGRFFVMAGRMFMVLRRLCMMFCALLAHRAFEVEVQTGSYSSRVRLQYAEWIAWHQRLRPR